MFSIFKKFRNKEIKMDIVQSISKLNGLSLLLIADTHRSLSDIDCCIIEKYRPNVNVIITLGDIPVESIKKINGDFGVLGNHDSFKGIENDKNLHLKCRIKDDIIFGGFEGSNRYKNGNFVMYSQSESIDMLEKLPYCDILITHDSCLKEKYRNVEILDNIDDPHSGLKGIDKYIIEKKPLIHLYGHHHINKETEKYGIKSIGIYGIVLLEIIHDEIIITVLKE